MALAHYTERVPLAADKDGIIRVGDTRVALDRIIHSFLASSTPEQIVQQCDTLDLADVYSVIAYYLRHHEEVDAYLQQQKVEADKLQQEIEAKINPIGIRQRLLARKGNF